MSAVIERSASRRGGWPAGPVPVVGFARSGRAVAAALAAHGVEVTVLDDAPDADARRAAAEMGVSLVGPLPAAVAGALAAAHEIVVPSPGVSPNHPACAAAVVISEVELGWRVSSVPMLAVTGSNGKTTVTSLVASMAAEAGLAVAAAGNIGTPLVEAAQREDLDLLVVEVSSFQLAGTTSFAPHVAVYLNFSPDHLNWHGDLEDYRLAKARIFANQQAGDVAVANASDAVTLGAARLGRGRLVVFGGDERGYRLVAGELLDPAGELILAARELGRRMPHDLVNALAATAAAEAAGIGREACRRALRSFEQLPHRVQLVGELGGLRYYDDSKATTPGAVRAALAGIGACVLIAGGRNKGLDLEEIARGLDGGGGPVRAVVAIGEAAPEIEKAFDGRWPVRRAGTMDEAVAVATALAGDGDAVLLSPGCASFDWYRDYAERGDDFARAVRELAQGGGVR